MWPFSQDPRRFGTQDDCVWLSREERRAGVVERVRYQAAKGPVLVVVQFPNSLIEAKTALESAGMRIEILDGGDGGTAIGASLAQAPAGTVGLILGSQIREGPDPEVEVPVDEPPDGRQPFAVIAFERYPMRNRDDRVWSLGAELNQTWSCTLEYHVALDEPPLTFFASENIAGALRSLGLKAVSR